MYKVMLSNGIVTPTAAMPRRLRFSKVGCGLVLYVAGESTAPTHVDLEAM